MAVLLLLFLYQGREHAGWGGELAVLTTVLLASLAVIRAAKEEMLVKPWFTAGLFIGDAVAATVVLRLIEGRPELYLVYFLVVFGAALTRSWKQGLLVAGTVIALFIFSRTRPGTWQPYNHAFWLRLMFLAVSAAVLAILSLDAQAAQEEEKRRFDERLIQVERLATLGRVAAEVAHRIKGPLTTIAVDAEVLSARHAKDKATLKELAQIRDEVERCKEILKNLLDLGRIEEMDSEPLDLRVPVERALKLIEPQARDRGVELSTSGLAAPMKSKGDESLIQEAVYALLQNALEASKRGGRVRLEAASWGGSHRLAVADDGAGVKPGDLERIFEPFFTTKKEGSGLGLSAALRIAQKHGGTVEADSAGSGRGAKFTLVLPSTK